MVHLAEVACFGYDSYAAKRRDLLRTKGRIDASCNIEHGIWISNHESRARESEEMGVLVKLTAGE
jgi:hypothetical protein